MIRGLFSFALYLAVLLTALWTCAALWIDGPAARPLAGLLVAGYAVLTAIVLVRFRPSRTKAPRQHQRAWDVL